MLRLFHTGGSQEIDLLGVGMHPEVWARTRNSTSRLLEARRRHDAAAILKELPFEIREGTNGFGDEFLVLYANLPLKRYLEVADLKETSGSNDAFAQIAYALGENDVGVRFIAVTLEQESQPGIVPPPSPQVSSEVLESALADVERTLAEGRPASGIDRVHTALHAYLRGVAESEDIESSDASVTILFKRLRENHPSLREDGPRASDVSRVLGAMATIVDAINPLRNKASLAHPTDELLPDAEAMLVINAVRTIFHYVETRLGDRSRPRTGHD
jgi:hypothetical protein